MDPLAGIGTSGAGLQVFHDSKSALTLLMAHA